jgi:hypothetical protein
VSDASQRDLERLSEQGDLAARVRLLRGRIRDGTLLASRLELAAYCGDEAAFDALDPAQRAELMAAEWHAHDARGAETRLDEAWAVFDRAGAEAETCLL